jgi:hypothetical protein
MVARGACVRRAEIGDWGILIVDGRVREGLGERVRAKDAKDAKVRKGDY